jgi:MFS family permease
MSFVSAGVVAGPAIAGTVLELAGYWPAWSVPLGLLAIDIMMRSIMIEGPDTSSSYHNINSTDTAVSNGEASALLADDQPSNFGSIVETCHENHGKRSFYQIMLSDVRVIVGLSNTILSSSLLASFDATLTLHLRDAFGWGSLAAGMMFLSLQLPFIFLGSLAGWLRDRVGLRYPTAVGWALLAPVMWLIGVPGTDVFPPGSILNGDGMFIFAVIAFGVVVPFVRGAGYLQLSSKSTTCLIHSIF